MQTLGSIRKTLKDVARDADLSVATVSAVLNGSDKFAEDTRRRVWEAAQALNYTPNQQARTLRTGGRPEARLKTGIIIHVSHLGSDAPMGYPLEAPRSLMLEWLAQQRGLYTISYWYHQRKGFQCLPVLNGLVDGALVGTPHLQVVGILRDKLPLVLMDVPFKAETADVPTVNMDLRHGFTRLMHMLAEHGHRRIGTVHSTHQTDGANIEAPNLQAVQEGAATAGLQIPDDCVLSDDIMPETHDRAMKGLTDALIPLIESRRITAVVAAGSSYAISLYENLTARGIQIPDDVTLAMPYSGMDAPPYGVASVAHNWEAILETALDVLSVLIDGKRLHCREYLVPPLVLTGATLGTCPDGDRVTGIAD